MIRCTSLYRIYFLKERWDILLNKGNKIISFKANKESILKEYASKKKNNQIPFFVHEELTAVGISLLSKLWNMPK